MTDDPNVEPKRDAEPDLEPELEPEPEPNVLRDEVGPTEAGDEPTEGGEDAQDLDATQLEAAAHGAEDEVGDAGDEEAEALETAEDDTVVLGPGGVEPAPVGAPGARRGEPEVRGPRPRGPKTSRTAFAIDPALRIRDRVSAVFVIGSAVVFALIIANAMLFGHGGAFTPIPTPSPIPQATEAPSEAPSPSPAPSITAAPTTAPSGSTAPTVNPTTAPSPAAS